MPPPPRGQHHSFSAVHCPATAGRRLPSLLKGLGQLLPTGSLTTGLFIRCQAPLQVPLEAVMTQMHTMP